jgi:hypothetical protein
MDVLLVAFLSAAFVSVAGISFSVGHLVTSRNRLQRRLPAGERMSDALARPSGDNPDVLAAEPFTKDGFGIGRIVTKEVRLNLVRSGFFSPQAIRFYVLARVCAVIAIPSLVLLGCVLLAPSLSTLNFALIAAASVGVGILGPDAYLSRLQSSQTAEYRVNSRISWTC